MFAKLLKVLHKNKLALFFLDEDFIIAYTFCLFLQIKIIKL